MNHISTLTITKQYIEQQMRRISQENSDDVLGVMMSMMAAVDERFKAHEAVIHKVHQQLKVTRPAKEKPLEHSNPRH